MASDSSPPKSEGSTSQHRRSFLPRFGLRSLFIFALLFCLLFGWIGRGYYRVRQENAAVETILRSGGGLYTELQRGLYPAAAPGELSGPSSLPVLERAGDLLFRSVGLRQRPAVAKAELRIFDDDDAVADEALAALAVLPEIRSLTLMGSAFDDRSLQTLDLLPRLEELYLLRTEATANGISGIAAPERLRYLHVEEHYLQANVLAGTGRLRGLREVDVINCLLTREDVAALASLPELEILQLVDVQLVGHDVLAPLAEAQKLRSLDLWLAYRQANREELQAIAAAPALDRLEIDLAEADLDLLLKAEKLRFLHVYDSVSEEAARAFSLERPECVIRIYAPSDTRVHLQNGQRAEPLASPVSN